MIDQQTLQAIAGREIPDGLASALSSTAHRFKIDTPLRFAHFLAQLLHETGAFRWNRELWGPTAAQKRYEGRADLGNTDPGDGFRFRGRGYIQLTGRANYRAYSDFLGVDLVAFPDVVASLPFAAHVAGWYWNSRRINEYADADDIRRVTRAINGGYNGLADRREWLAKVKAAL